MVEPLLLVVVVPTPSRCPASMVLTTSRTLGNACRCFSSQPVGSIPSGAWTPLYEFLISCCVVTPSGSREGGKACRADTGRRLARWRKASAVLSLAAGTVTCSGGGDALVLPFDGDVIDGRWSFLDRRAFMDLLLALALLADDRSLLLVVVLLPLLPLAPAGGGGGGKGGGCCRPSGGIASSVVPSTAASSSPTKASRNLSK
mmetsp:Transcript_20249/g.44216  ORF Transcript_20249/g.44216 Transcript_20249/m.44216 type:complete len:202 (-) Transcript_20249:158-763(-)